MADKEQWFAIVYKDTGELYSSGSVIADPMPDQFEAIPIDGQPDHGTQDWDKDKRTFVTRPVPTIIPVTVGELQGQLQDIMAKLSVLGSQS